MSTAITRITQGKAELTEAEALIMMEMGEDNNSFTMQPSRIKIAPGGIGQYMLGDDAAKTFTGVVAISQIARGYWPSKDTTGEPPICASPDGLRGVFNAEASESQLHDAAAAHKTHLAIKTMSDGKSLPSSWDCAGCPLNQWGSAAKGKGKACKELRRLLVLVDGWALPALMTLPPTSNKPWDAYCSGLAAKKSAYFAVRTKFELDSANSADGQKYNFVKLTAVETLTADRSLLEAVSEIRRQYRSLVSSMAVDAEDYETNGVSAEYRVTENDTSDTPF